MIFAFLCLSSSYNIQRGNCQVLIDEYFYDLTAFRNIDPLQPQTDFNYFIRLCPNEETSMDDGWDAFLIQLSKTTYKSAYVITQNSFDYRPLNPENFDAGIIYYADSEPFESPLDGSIRTLDLEFRISCDPSVDELKDPKYIISDNLTAGKIIVSFPHKAGCVASHMATPTPTQIYGPDCEYVDRLDNETSRGVWADLNFMNDGPYGIKSKHTLNGEDAFLYFQPCERMLCPPNFICEETADNYSSAWLCNKSFHCKSYGVSTETYSFRPIDGDLTKGMQLKFEEKTNQHSIELSLTCNSKFPDGHIKWKTDAHFDGDDENSLVISGETNEVCIVPIPTVTPSPDKDFCKFYDVVGNYYVDIDLQKYNNEENNGWKSDVQVQAGHDSYPDSQLLFKPCGNITCPPDAFCNGDEDAEIWLCRVISDVLECEGYGLFKNKVALELYDDDDIKDGIQASYTGDGKRKGSVIYLCDESLQEGQIKMPESVNLNYRSLTFYAYAKDACPKQNSTQPPSSPITQTQPVSPTQEPTQPISPTQEPDDDTDDRIRLDKITGGSVFLFIILCVAIIYIFAGVLFNFVKNGTIDIPNHEFWINFAECIETAVLYIVSCGKNSNNYSNI